MYLIYFSILCQYLLGIYASINWQDDKFNLRHPTSFDTASDLCYAVPLTTAAKTKGAVCSDGTTPRYYWRNGTESTKFQIYFQGGAWCAGIGSPVSQSINDCYARSWSYLGSTNTSYDNDTLAINQEYMSTGCGWNTLMCNWNLAYIRYCDGT
eukprot:881992_1